MHRYMYDGNYRNKLPGLSEEIYKVLESSDLKMKNAEYWQKRRKIQMDAKTERIQMVAPREESLERLIEMGREFVDVQERVIDKVVRRDTYRKLHLALRSLPIESREVLELSFFLEMTEREIAKEIGVSKTMIHKRIHSAIKTLKEFMENS